MDKVYIAFGSPISARSWRYFFSFSKQLALKQARNRSKSNNSHQNEKVHSNTFSISFIFCRFLWDYRQGFYLTRNSPYKFYWGKRHLLVESKTIEIPQSITSFPFSSPRLSGGSISCCTWTDSLLTVTSISRTSSSPRVLLTKKTTNMNKKEGEERIKQ